MIVKRRPDPQIRWFPEARFGMFIHFGLYALLERGEWVMYRADIPREEYEKLMPRFNPHRFDAGQWVEEARRSGCRYMTVTAKHHDGFCLFDSELTDFKITNTPFKRDLIGELVQACQQANMPIILYYSQPDWHHPCFVHRPGAFKDLQYERPDDTPDWPRFVEYYHGQVRELCTRYGKIDGIWFDGVQRTEKQWQGRKIYDLIKKHQPHAVVNDRAGYGDFFTPERSLTHLAAAAGYLVEACQSVAAGAWGYIAETPLYSTQHLLHSMLRMVGAGGNYLLNIGPRADGTLPGDWLERMHEMGQWLATHQKSVYGTAGCPLWADGADRVFTSRDSTLYVHVLKWPDTDCLKLPELRRAPLGATMLADGKKLDIAVEDDTVCITGLPASPPDALSNVIALDCADSAFFRQKPATPALPVIECQPGKPCTLMPEQARLDGFGFKGNVLRTQVIREAEIVVKKPAETAIWPVWTPEQSARWTVSCPRPGRYRVFVELACPAQYAGTAFRVKVGQTVLQSTVPATGSADDYKEVQLGDVKLPAGETTVLISPTKPHYASHFAWVRGIRLQPLDKQ